MNHLIDHDMNIPVIDGKMDLLAVENELKKRLGNELDVVHFYELWPENRLKDQHCKPWLLEVNHNQYLNSCNLTTPSKIEAEIYPKAMRLSNFSSDLEIVPHKWFNFVSNYFEKRDFGTRKKTHNVLLKIKELFKIFNPSVYVIEGVDQSFGCFEDNLEVGTSIEETFRHGGKYEKRLVSEFERWPNGFHLMGEKDKENRH